MSTFLAGAPRSDAGGGAGAHQAFPPHLRLQHLPGESAVQAWVCSSCVSKALLARTLDCVIMRSSSDDLALTCRAWSCLAVTCPTRVLERILSLSAFRLLTFPYLSRLPYPPTLCLALHWAYIASAYVALPYPASPYPIFVFTSLLPLHYFFFHVFPSPTLPCHTFNLSFSFTLR